MKTFCLLLLTGVICFLSCRQDHIPRVLVGQEYGDGIVFYVDQSGQHGWIAAKEDLPMAHWGVYDSINLQVEHYPATNATSSIDGFDNTEKIIAAYGDTLYAAKSCHNYTGGGFYDWYLPAKDQLDSLYGRSISNLTSLGMLQYMYYWSSTEYSNFDAWIQDFGTGFQYHMKPAGIYWPNKALNGFICPIRSF